MYTGVIKNMICTNHGEIYYTNEDVDDLIYSVECMRQPWFLSIKLDDYNMVII